jgi:HAD superfamily hydrolase (TIGR01509 family)
VPAPYRLVIFDCDGVLVDSEPISLRLDVELLAELGMPLSRQEIIDRYVGRSPEVIAHDLEQHLGRPLPAGWRQDAQARLHELFRSELAPIEGLPAALAQIDLPICVASSSSHRALRLKLELTGLLQRFDGRIFSAQDVARGKPAPDLFLHAAAALDTDPTRCVVVEDSRYGVQAARAAGMDCLAYHGGVTSADDLRGPGTIAFDDMRRLPELLAGASAAAA